MQAESGLVLHYGNTMNHRKEAAQRFAEVLRKRLTERFGSMPSAARLALHFNLRAYGADTISPEAARRWIKGISVPELSRFRVLNDWLDLERETFRSDEAESLMPSNGNLTIAPRETTIRVPETLPPDPLADYRNALQDNGRPEEERILTAFRRMNRRQRKTLLLIVGILLTPSLSGRAPVGAR